MAQGMAQRALPDLIRRTGRCPLPVTGATYRSRSASIAGSLDSRSSIDVYVFRQPGSLAMDSQESSYAGLTFLLPKLRTTFPTIGT
jgi:hypothetical protein